MSILKQLKERNESGWSKEWQDCDLSKLDEIFTWIAATMLHPNHYYLPTDSLGDVIANKTGDMREVVVLLELEKRLKMDMSNFEEISMQDLIKKMGLK